MVFFSDNVVPTDQDPLQKLNAFEEEVDIVSDVLAQQIKVLSEFRDYLDPAKFKRPTTARKMRFEFENQGLID